MPRKVVNNGVVGLNLNPKINSHGFRSRKKKLKGKSVLKMLAVMEASQNAGPSNPSSSASEKPPDSTPSQEFLSSGRTGRRNALPDILGQHAIVTSSDLPSKLQALSTKDKLDQQKNEAGPSTSSS